MYIYIYNPVFSVERSVLYFAKLFGVLENSDKIIINGISECSHVFRIVISVCEIKSGIFDQFKVKIFCDGRLRGVRDAITVCLDFQRASLVINQIQYSR